MKANPVFLDFLNREAYRATDRTRKQGEDIDILRTLTIALPYGLSVNISQLTEYCYDKPLVLSAAITLVNAGIIDATSNAASIDELISDRQTRYSHAADRYPFYFGGAPTLQQLKLGTRNEFSMTTDLANLLTAYTPSEFDFHATRMNPQDKLDFEAGHRATVKKILDREDLAITRDLLESKRGGQDLTPQQLLATTRVISALYMKNYAIRRGLATCTGIPSFPYREVTECFPTFDYPLLRRTIVALGGEEFLVRRPLEEIIAGYSSQQHKLFSYHLEAFLEASACYLKTKSNHPDSLSSMRAIFEQFFFKLAERTRSVPISLVDFYAEGSAILATVGTEIANKNAVFAGEWRKYMPEASMGLVAITTATDSEDKALFAELKAQGFTKVRTIRAGENFVQEYSRGVGQRIVHLRTGAGSLGVLSAGSILPDVLRELSPDYLISAGICFGLKPLKDGEPFQKLGDVVCATSIHDYETVRQGNEVELRGNLLPVGPNILQATRIARSQLGKVKYRFFEGQVVSGQKLVDSEEFVESLRARFPAALAGEMEGNAVASTSIYKGWQWILIKGICDWGMNKDDSWQAVAAERACRLAVATAMVLLTTPRT